MTEIEDLKATIVEARTGIEQLKQVRATLEGREREELHRHIQLMEEHLKDAQNALSKMEKHVAAVDVAKEATHALLRTPSVVPTNHHSDDRATGSDRSDYCVRGFVWTDS